MNYAHFDRRLDQEALSVILSAGSAMAFIVA
jgi:hypothetical protein